MQPTEYVGLLREVLRSQGNPDTAQGQMAYMRHQFEFFGLKMAQWTLLTKQFHAQYGLPDGEDLKAMARLCFEEDHREMHYFALETVQKKLKTQPPEFIDFLEELVLSRSWWDTVDWLNKLIGQHFLRFPALIQLVTARWVASENIWLQRLSIIFQLPYKGKTDTALLFGHIRQLAHSKEFFVQKGAGWALRQYARTNPDAVRQFVQTTPLASLTKREALKHIKDH